MCQEEISEIMKLQLASYSLLLDEYSTEYSYVAQYNVDSCS